MSNPVLPRGVALAAACAALLALGGCAAPRGALDWNRVSARDQHLFFPGSAHALPLASVKGGANGLLVGGGPAAAAEIVVQGDTAMLVTSERATALRAAPTQTLGAGQALPAPPGGALPQK